MCYNDKFGINFQGRTFTHFSTLSLPLTAGITIRKIVYNYGRPLNQKLQNGVPLTSVVKDSISLIRTEYSGAWVPGLWCNLLNARM